MIIFQNYEIAPESSGSRQNKWNLESKNQEQQEMTGDWWR